jgi:hypothetical protein
MKVCSVCNESKDLSCFFWKKKGETLEACCKQCSSARSLAWRTDNKHKIRDTSYKKKFGITLQEYETKLKYQNYCCAICETPQEEFNLRFAIDHDHKTGEVRDLLCGQCNIAIGMAKEDENILKKMIKYLQKHK